MYEMVLKLEPKILELATFFKETMNSEDIFETRISRLLPDYNWTELLLLNTLYNLGETGKGYYFESTNEYREMNIIEIRIVETPDELLNRYSNLLVYRSKDELAQRLSESNYLNIYLTRGLEVLKQAHKQNSICLEHDTLREWPRVRNLSNYFFEKSELIKFHRSESDWAYFYCPKELVNKIPWLYDKFVVYVTGVKGIYPYRRFEKIIHNKKATFEGYVYTYNCLDFMDWINSYVFEEYLFKLAPDNIDFDNTILIEV